MTNWEFFRCFAFALLSTIAVFAGFTASAVFSGLLCIVFALDAVANRIVEASRGTGL